MAKRGFTDKVIIKQRMLLIFGIIIVLFFGVSVRLVYIMVTKSEEYKGIANEQWTSEVKISAKRGKILDTNGNDLALSGNVYRIDVDMTTLNQDITAKKLSKEEISIELGKALNTESSGILKTLNKTLPNGDPIGSVNLMRRVEQAGADKVSALKLHGILISGDTERYYPYNNFLAQVLGHTNIDGDGLTGLEKEYDKELSGTPGVRYVEADRKGINYTISDFSKPQDGKDVETTIDETIQLICEKAASQAMIDNKAKGVTVIAMDPKTSAILAMVNKPDYNPNDPWAGNLSSAALQQIWRNKAVSDTFEPGSVFKVVTATAAMQEKLVSDSDRFVCNGSLTVANRVIHCWNTSGHGTESFLQILENSCNVGFMTLGKKIGAEKLNEYIAKFGFGKTTGIDLPGEAKGIVKTKNVSETDLATISFGQTDTVSPIQYITGFNIIANDGKWTQPHILKKIVQYGDNDNVTSEKDYVSTGEHQAIDPEVAKTLRSYLEKVVSEGGGRNAFIEGYHIAGKTGTAQKIDPVHGGYASGKYISSFAGMAPASDPKITLFVSIDEPDISNYYAGQITAPVAKQIFNDIFNYMALKSDASSADIAQSMLKDMIVPEVRGMKKADALKTLKDSSLTGQPDTNGDIVIDMNPKPGSTVKEGTNIILYTGAAQNNNNTVIVPDLTGYNMDNVNSVLGKLGLKATFSGSGIVSEQSLGPGTEIAKGNTISFTMTTLGD